MSQFIAKDGYLDTVVLKDLARDITKAATREGWKPSTVYYTAKLIPPYVSEKAKAGGAAYEKKRAQPVKTRSRMPAVGSRVKMVIALPLYKGIEDTQFGKEVAQAIKAIEAHTARATKTVESLKKAAQKNKEVLGKEFDKNLSVIEKLFLDAGMKKSDLAIGVSPMGKSMVVRLPNGGYVSIGKADKEKFAKAKEPPKEGGAFGRKPKAEEPVKKSKKSTKVEEPIKKKKKRPA